VKLRGRTTTPDGRRGRTLSSRARGAKHTTPHGPLQRLLGGSGITNLNNGTSRAELSVKRSLLTVLLIAQ